MDIRYFPAIWAAGYVGFVAYTSGTERWAPSACIWIIPGTWEYDWDNR